MQLTGRQDKHYLMTHFKRHLANAILLFLSLIFVSSSMAAPKGQVTNPHTRKPDFCIVIETENQSVQNKKCKPLRVTNGSLTDNGSYFSLSISGGGGDSVSIDGGAVVDPDFVSTGQIDFTDTSNTVTGDINDNSILEADLKTVDASSDEDILTKEDTTGDFEWHSFAELMATLAEGGLPNDNILEEDLKAVNAAVDEDILTRETTTGDFEWHSGPELCVAITGHADLCDGSDDGGGSGAFSDASDPVVLNTTTKDVNIGTTHNNSAKLSVDGDADQVQLSIQGNGTQTNYLIVAENSAGTDQFTLSNAGAAVFAGAVSGSNLSGTNTGDDDVPESGDFGNGADLESTGALSDDVVAAAEMADADHGDVSWTTGVATVENLQCTDCVDETEIQMTDDNIQGARVLKSFTLTQPANAYDNDTQLLIWPDTDAAFTITRLYVTCDGSSNEIAGDLKYADAFIGFANATVINDFDTTSGVRDDSSITSGSVAAGKDVYIQFDSQPNTAITQCGWKLHGDYD